MNTAWDKGIFKKREEIVTRRIAGETILVPIRGTLADMEKIFALNPVAEPEPLIVDFQVAEKMVLTVFFRNPHRIVFEESVD